jgi:hypothetical protein
LLERALDPALDDHLAKVAELLKAGDQAGAAERFFDFRVADLAMGSGHFLTAAIDHIEGKMAAFLEEDGHQIPGVTKEIVLLGHAARDAMGDPDGVIPEGSSLLRRQIARRCIYGVDVNPISVELARVAIWIHTFVRGLPMSSLDHNLVCANSLTGIGTVDEALDVLVPDRKGVMTFFDAPITEALGAASKVLADVALLSEVNRSETQAASRAVKRAQVEAEAARLLFDAAVLNRIGQGRLITGFDPKSIAAEAAEPEAQAAVAPLHCGHMPVLFPEVFLRPNGGFDVLVGNPPWEKIKVEEHQWWGLRFPGLRSLPMAQRTTRIAELRKERPDLVVAYEAEIAATNAARSVIAAAPYPGIGSGDIDLYKAFAWRNWLLVREGGALGLVMPRGALSGSGTEKWRREVLEKGAFSNVVIGTNSRGWLFESVEQRYSIALVCARRGGSHSAVQFAGPFYSQVEFEQGRDSLASVPTDEFLEWTSTAAFPLLPDAVSGDVFRQMKRNPSFNSLGDFRPYRELDATNDRSHFDTNLDVPQGALPVLTGSSFNLWSPDFGPPYAYGDDRTIEHILDKARRTSIRPGSAFYGMTVNGVEDLPLSRARIAFRDVTNSTNTRTMVCCLLPPGVALVHPAPYLVRRAASEVDEAYLLGVLCSIPFDWITRKLVELHMTFEVLDRMPIPDLPVDDTRRTRIVTIAGRLAAKDERFKSWADAVGVEVSSVASAPERESLEAGLDALVASAYGLTRDQVAHVFATFHRGWNYEGRLAAVLRNFDDLEAGHA